MDQRPTWVEHSSIGVGQGAKASGPRRRAFSANNATTYYCITNNQDGPKDDVGKYPRPRDQPFADHKDFLGDGVADENVVVNGQEPQLAKGAAGTMRTVVLDEDENFEETVDSFKSQLDRDREKWAQRMALRLLQSNGFQNGA